VVDISSRFCFGACVPRKYRPGPFLNMFVATQLVDQVTAREFERAGLNVHAIGVLQLIWLNEPVTPTQLERITGMRPTTLRDRVNELIERGEVRRVPNPADGRSQLLETTPAGDRSADDARIAFRKAWTRIERRIGRSLAEFDPPIEELILALREELSGR
jgi:DNA-binding MarR family transcriptional regulator